MNVSKEALGFISIFFWKKFIILFLVFLVGLLPQTVFSKQQKIC